MEPYGIVPFVDLYRVLKLPPTATRGGIEEAFHGLKRTRRQRRAESTRRQRQEEQEPVPEEEAAWDKVCFLRISFSLVASLRLCPYYSHIAYLPL